MEHGGGDQRPQRGLALQPRRGGRGGVRGSGGGGGGGGGQTVSLGIRTRWEKRKSGGFQSLHSDGENNPAQGEKKKITNRWGGIVPICVRNEGVD